MTEPLQGAAATIVFVAAALVFGAVADRIERHRRRD